MAYSDNIRNLTLVLCDQGHSPESITDLYSEFIGKDRRDSIDFFKQLAESCSLIFTEADWRELYSNIPSPKTIRKWLSVRKTEVLLPTSSISNEDCDTNIEPKTEIDVADSGSAHCPAPPDNIDVALLKSWGIKSEVAASLLADWRKCHSHGLHIDCECYQIMAEDIKNGMPYDWAFTLFVSGVKAKEFGLKEAEQENNLIRLYRPWEGKQNKDACIREIERLHLPARLYRQRHIGQIVQLLRTWRDEIADTNWTHFLGSPIEIKKHPLFKSLMVHCHEVSRKLEAVESEALRYESEEESWETKLSDDIPSGATNVFIRSVILSASDKTKPEYIKQVIGIENHLNIELGDDKFDIVVGNSDLVDDGRQVHEELVRRCQQDSQIKKLRTQKNKLNQSIMALLKAIDWTLDKESYNDEWCVNCVDSSESQ